VTATRPETTSLRWAALGGLLAFLAIIVAEHLLNPSLDPLEHQVSEYVRTDSGVLMVAGFVAWSLSLVATAALARRHGDRLLAVLLASAAAGLLLAALFPTQTSAGKLPAGSSLTLTGHLHDLGSGLTILSLLGAAAWTSIAARTSRTARLSFAALLLSAVVVSVALLIVGPSVGGLRQRLLLLIGCAWQLLFLLPPEANSSPPG